MHTDFLIVLQLMGGVLLVIGVVAGISALGYNLGYTDGVRAPKNK